MRQPARFRALAAAYRVRATGSSFAPALLWGGAAARSPALACALVSTARRILPHTSGAQLAQASYD